MVAPLEQPRGRVLCQVCGLTDMGTVPCVVCQRHACADCSHVAIKRDKRTGKSLTDICPEFVEILCSQCSPPGFGSTSRIYTPDHSPSSGVLVPC